MKGFKRFTDLTIEELPETARLVVLIGPNGCGKSSVFDALEFYTYFGGYVDRTKTAENFFQISEYYFKSRYLQYGYSHYRNLIEDEDMEKIRYPSKTYLPFLDHIVPDYVDVKFHGVKELRFDLDYEWGKCVHVRSAYRNYAMPHSHTINRDDPLKERRLVNLAENDEAIAANYWRLASLWLERSSEFGQNESLADLQNEILSELRNAMGRLFDDPKLELKNLGHPADGEFFQFDKGTSKRFSFQNLASGEKAALDLLLDVIVTKTEFDETIICIDEPEAHLHTKLQGQLLEELYELVPDKSQLWIATHSIGMVRKAQDISLKNPESVVFLDFGNHDFDKPVVLTPAVLDSAFWARTYEVALDDLAELVAPKQIILCEGNPEEAAEGFDAACYNRIFESRHPETRFISIGSRTNLKNPGTVTNLIPALEAIAKGAEILRLQDRDDATDEAIARDAEKGIRTLSRRMIECYLIDDEVLTKLSEKEGNPEKAQELLEAKQKARGELGNKPKSIAQRVHGAAREAFQSPMGNDCESFMTDILAPLIQPDMDVYRELETAIFASARDRFNNSVRWAERDIRPYHRKRDLHINEKP